jgi:putative oxidoreductase
MKREISVMYQRVYSNVITQYEKITSVLDYLSKSIPQLLLRWVLAWEFGKAGWEKLHGTNWFADITFPFPFNILPTEYTWQLATYIEIAGAAALLIGFATRFFSMSLIILTVVAIYTVHWPAEWSTLNEFAMGFRIVDEANDGFGNYELPLLFVVMLMPLLFGGAGKLSMDYLIHQKLK